MSIPSSATLVESSTSYSPILNDFMMAFCSFWVRPFSPSFDAWPKNFTDFIPSFSSFWWIISRVSRYWVNTIIFEADSSLLSSNREVVSLDCPLSPSSCLRILVISRSFGCSHPCFSALCASLIAFEKFSSHIRDFAAFVFFLRSLSTYLLNVWTPWVSISSWACWTLMTALRMETALKSSLSGLAERAISPWTRPLAIRISFLPTETVLIMPIFFKALSLILRALSTFSLIFASSSLIFILTQSISTGLKYGLTSASSSVLTTMFCM